MSNDMTRKKLNSKWIRVRDLSVVWVEAQRPKNVRKINAIANAFDDRAFGVITVADTGDGHYHIIDGQHRVAAVERLWGDAEFVPCQVIEDVESPESAAEVWLVQNTERSKPTAYERFNVAVVAHKEPELSIAAVINGCGYEVGHGKLMAVNACKLVYKNVGEEGLRWTLKTIREVWGDTKDARTGFIIQGFGLFYEKFYGQIDDERLIRNLQKKYTAARLTGMAKAAREIFDGSMGDNVTRCMTQVYNEHFRANSTGRLRFE